MKNGQLVVADLTKRSKKGIELAKKLLLEEKIDDLRFREALEYYLANWEILAHSGLLSVACESVGGKIDDILPTQAAMAMMAAAFDIHDDIIDKSLTKHEKQTVYGKFGTEISLLLGNSFLIEGFKLLVDSTTMLPRQKGKLAIDMTKRLLFEAGNAHALEIGFRERKIPSTDEYMKIIEMKAAGIEVDMFMGALFGGGGDGDVEVLARIGRILGILIALRENFIDIFEAEELRQRIAVHDFPLPLFAAMQDKKAEDEIQRILSKDNWSENEISQLLDITLETEPVLQIKKKMQLLMGEAMNLVKKLPNSKLHGKLQAIIAFTLEDL